MKQNNKVLSKDFNDTETMAYIVKGPVPKSGQTASSGGIRENGKLCAQYRDPMPYTEIPSPTNGNQADIQTAQLKKDITLDIVSLFWYEFGKPLTKSLFKVATQKLATRINKDWRQERIICPQVVDVVNETVSPKLRDRSNVILFPANRAG